MRHEATGLTIAVVANDVRLGEYDVKPAIPAKDGSELLQCYIPVVPDACFKVIIRGPRLEGDRDINAVLSVDGEVVVSKCRSGQSDRVNFTLSTMRVSTTHVRPLRFSRAKFDPNAIKEINPHAGCIRVDIWCGWKEDVSFDPVVKYVDEVTNHSIREQLSNGLIPADEISSTFRPSDCKGAVASSDYVVDYGPLAYKSDRRRRFNKVQRILTCLFFYRDLSFIQMSNLRQSASNLKAKTAQLARMHDSTQPITLDDDDDDDEDDNGDHLKGENGS